MRGRPIKRTLRGGQRRYSDLAIETALTLRLIYHLPLRQAEGFLHALFGMMCLDLSAPDYTTLSNFVRFPVFGSWLSRALLHEDPLRVGWFGPYFS